MFIVKLQLISKLKSTQLNLNNLRDEVGVDAIFTVPPTRPANFSTADNDPKQIQTNFQP